MHVQVRSRRPEAWVRDQRGRRARRDDYDLLVSGKSRVYKPDGTLLLALLPGALSEEGCELAYPFLHRLRSVLTQNRGAYSASPRVFKIRKAGYRSSTSETPPVRSAVVGHVDRYPRYPFCNCLPIVRENPEGWASLQPMTREVAALLAATVPGRAAAQLGAAESTHPAYVIPGTPFTTLTVNNTFAGGYHVDAGDFRDGFGAMSVLRRGAYRGCELVIPAYGVAVDLGDRDLILFDVHEVHGNTPLEGEGPECLPEEGGHERISVVYYFRERMVDCLAPELELERAKQLRGTLEA